MSQPLTVMVIGASRGIGRALVDCFARVQGTQVIATVRKQSDTYFSQSNVTSVILDLNDPKSVSHAATEVKEVDVLLINAGMSVAEPVMDLDEADLRMYFDVNVIGPWRVVKTFLPALRARKTRKIVFTSSMSGSMQLNYEGKASVRGAYAMTKATINMFALQLHQDLNESEGFTVIPIHPGWVDTALGNPGSAYQGAMPPSESAAGIADVTLKLESKILGNSSSGMIGRLANYTRSQHQPNRAKEDCGTAMSSKLEIGAVLLMVINLLDWTKVALETIAVAEVVGETERVSITREV